jgi:hypothetical protein
MGMFSGFLTNALKISFAFEGSASQPHQPRNRIAQQRAEFSHWPGLICHINGMKENRSAFHPRGAWRG